MKEEMKEPPVKFKDITPPELLKKLRIQIAVRQKSHDSYAYISEFFQMSRIKKLRK